MLNLIHVARTSRQLRRAVVGAAACVAFGTVMLGASVEAHAECDPFMHPVDCGNDICCPSVCGGSCSGPGTQCCGGCPNSIDYPLKCGVDSCCGNTIGGPQVCRDGECHGPDTGGTAAATSSGAGAGSGAGTGSGGGSSDDDDGDGGGSGGDGSDGGCSAAGQAPGVAGLSLLGLAALLFTRRRSPRAS